MSIRVTLFSLLSFICWQSAFGQLGGFAVEPDTVITVADEDRPPDGPKANIFKGKPGRATLYSLIVPGAGQIYNGSYWKAPVVWGAVGAVGTIMAFNIDQYKDFDQRYRNAVIAEMEGQPNPDPGGLSTSQLFDLRTQANKNRQLSIVIFSFVWMGNAVEAYVDGHLKEFDISDDLSIRWKPIKAGEGPVFAQTGVTFTF